MHRTPRRGSAAEISKLDCILKSLSPFYNSTMLSSCESPPSPLHHVLRNVLELDEEQHHLEATLEREDMDLFSLLWIRESDLKTLTHVETLPNGSKREVPIANSVLGKIRAFQFFILHLQEIGKGPELDDDAWCSLTATDFHECKTTAPIISHWTNLPDPIVEDLAPVSNGSTNQSPPVSVPVVSIPRTTEPALRCH